MKMKLILLFIVVIGFLLRVVALDQFPPALNWDEVSHGYNAYSILNTGADEWGVMYPSIFRAYGDYKLPIYIYSTVPFVSIFGMTPLGVRLPSVLAGTALIVVTYFLTKLLFEKYSYSRTVALTASVLVALSPWSLFVSRVALEANLAMVFITLAIYFFVKGIATHPLQIFLSSLFFSLSVWTYNSARVFVPLFVILLVALYRKQLAKLFKTNASVSILSTLTLGVFLGLMFFQLFSRSGQARYQNLQILDEGAIQTINEARNTSGHHPFIARLVHNKATFFAGRVVTQYINHFNPQYLFVSGGSHYQFSIPGRGMMFFFTAPFFYIGLTVVLKNAAKDKVSRLMLLWLLLAPVASSITRDSPHVLRSILMVPLIMIITAYGVVRIGQVTKKSGYQLTYAVVLSVLLLFSFADYIEAAIMQYRPQYSWAWQYGYRDVVTYISQNEDKYDAVILTKKYGEPHEFVLFYSRWDPKEYNTDPKLIRFNQSNWWWVDRFDKYYFVNDWNINRNSQIFELESGDSLDCNGIKCLLITAPADLGSSWSKINTIYLLDNQPAFEIYEN